MHITSHSSDEWYDWTNLLMIYLSRSIWEMRTCSTWRFFTDSQFFEADFAIKKLFMRWMAANAFDRFFLHSATFCKMLLNVLRVRRKSRCRNWTWEFRWSNSRPRNEKKKYRDNFFSLLRILNRWHADNYGKDPARVHRGNVGMPLLNWSKLPE